MTQKPNRTMEPRGITFFTAFWGLNSRHRELNIGILHGEITVKFS